MPSVGLEKVSNESKAFLAGELLVLAFLGLVALGILIIRVRRVVANTTFGKSLETT